MALTDGHSMSLRRGRRSSLNRHPAGIEVMGIPALRTARPAQQDLACDLARLRTAATSYFSRFREIAEISLIAGICLSQEIGLTQARVMVGRETLPRVGRGGTVG